MDDLKDTWKNKEPISEAIKKRIKEEGDRFHSNDNISKFIKDGEIDLLQDEVEKKFKDVLNCLLYTSPSPRDS